MGDDEAAQERVLLKPLRDRSEQQSIPRQEIPARLLELLEPAASG
jgi:histidyl-tRNA synthetase